MKTLPDDTGKEPLFDAEAKKPQIWPMKTPDKFDISKCKSDPNSLVPTNLLKDALAYYESHKDKISNHNFIGIVDFSKPSSKARFFMVSLSDVPTIALHVAHGSGSDPDNTGMATLFSNTPGSHQSSLGFYLVAEQMVHKGAPARRLDGLSPTNFAARNRAILIHGASYVHDENIKQGRSWGCFAFSMEQIEYVVSTLPEGSLLYAGLGH